jgi:hypothetical protein
MAKDILLLSDVPQFADRQSALWIIRTPQGGLLSNLLPFFTLFRFHHARKCANILQISIG